MASILRVPVVWTGATGLPGVSVFHGALTTPGVVTDLVTFFSAIPTKIPTAITVDVPESGDMIDDATGTLSGSWTDSSGGPVDMTGTGEYAAGVGVAITWNTNGIRNGRRVRGRTFLCPLTVACFDSDGTIAGAILGDIRTAANTLAAGGNLLVWSRPSSPAAADGESHVVTSAYCR